ncbi:MAG: hypothetical protein Ct9H300mP19_00080 [Dehalococcoidia bacterium]|nr:MAG: hypothetical protein Ct9H300mP19_00080 [Dehalococcoidia bacterium]
MTFYVSAGSTEKEMGVERPESGIQKDRDKGQRVVTSFLNSLNFISQLTNKNR